MILFPALAMLVWWGSLRWRRTLLGLVWTVVGSALPLGVIWIQKVLEHFYGADWFRIEIVLVMSAYSALLLGGGLMLVSMPGRIQAEPGVSRPCKHCGYELRGLAERDEAATCPECGEVNEPKRTMAAIQRERFGEARRRLELMKRGIDPDAVTDPGSAADGVSTSDKAEGEPEQDDQRRGAQGQQQAQGSQQLA